MHICSNAELFSSEAGKKQSFRFSLQKLVKKQSFSFFLQNLVKKNKASRLKPKNLFNPEHIWTLFDIFNFFLLHSDSAILLETDFFKS